ncbi:hypothetical protein ABTA56_19410, partial [Acinetobacter baumannii]
QFLGTKVKGGLTRWKPIHFVVKLFSADPQMILSLYYDWMANRFGLWWTSSPTQFWPFLGIFEKSSGCHGEILSNPHQ